MSLSLAGARSQGNNLNERHGKISRMWKLSTQLLRIRWIRGSVCARARAPFLACFCSLVHSLVRSFVGWLAGWLFRSFVRSFARPAVENLSLSCRAQKLQASTVWYFIYPRYLSSCAAARASRVKYFYFTSHVHWLNKFLWIETTVLFAAIH